MEIWDAYKSDGTLANCDLIRGEKIPQGLFHLVCNVMVKHVDGTYLLMQRDFEKQEFPGKFECSAGGSALKGENAITAARRELFEETGIMADELIDKGFRINEQAQCIFHEFLCKTDCDKSSIQLQKGETIAYRWVNRNEFIESLNREEIASVLIEKYRRFLEEEK